MSALAYESEQPSVALPLDISGVLFEANKLIGAARRADDEAKDGFMIALHADDETLILETKELMTTGIDLNQTQRDAGEIALKLLARNT